MALPDWIRKYGLGALDDTAADGMPDLADDATPGDNTGDLARTSVPESMRDSMIELETQVGEPTAPATGSLLGIVKEDGGIEAAFSEKATPVSADKVMIEDSEDGGAHKWAQAGNLPAGAPPLLSVDSITAFATGGQGSATELAWNSAARITTVATTGDSVKLAAAPVANERIMIRNDGANACDVFPPTGGQINAAGTNTAVSLTAGSTLTIVAFSATQFYTF